MTISTSTRDSAAMGMLNPALAVLGAACCRDQAVPASQSVRPWSDRRPGGTPASKGWAWEIVQDQGFLEFWAQGWGNRLLWQGRSDPPAFPLCPHPLPCWDRMELALAGDGCLEAHNLPVGPLPSLKSSVHQPAGPKVTLPL